MANTYIDIISYLAELVNYSRFFGPIFTWIIVAYIYFGIGVHSGNSLWKHLYLVCSYGLIANIFYTVGELAKGLEYMDLYINTFIYCKLPEAFFFALNEWGLVYINFVKIRTCIKSLKSRIWTIFINLFFIYLSCFHLYNAATEIKNKREKYVENKETKEEYESINALIYIPISILEIYFILLIVYASLKEDNDKPKDVLTVLLNSSLSRMFIVSLILLAIAVIACFTDGSDSNGGYKVLLKRLLIRLKGAIGIIYLIDLLMLRIDLDSNTIKKQESKLLKYSIKEKRHELNRKYETGEVDNFGLDPEDPYGLNKTPMDDYIQSTSSYKNSPNLENNNENLFINTPNSEYNSGSIFKTTPISEYPRDPSLLLPKETDTPMVSSIKTPYVKDMYSQSYINKKNRNSYKKLSNIYNNNNGEIRFSPTLSYRD
ncbi:hypothetical protein BCR32DRAFT_269069 [Anaeromyces robustus]|uniref:Uncharacterized protein n=1 Tax=Anaeromyces robustus TaxID=1754192 RepID=A0A1Y1X2P9_9FUNG|nr:hypothetical protein BCR32DRAFT_269069 [Anaeromyces robustus]|eukprot:ORX80077.1 hypothetical protein BCR32DRAFT_269069 [Anaeromyces robustus]